MSFFPRTLMIALAAVAFATSCGNTPKPDAGNPDGGGPDGCEVDADCGDERFFSCVDLACQPSCRAKADCTAAARGAAALPHCAIGLGCECDEGRCIGQFCSADSDCGVPGTPGTQVCRSGLCVDPPAASTVATCAVTPDFVVLKQGEKAKFWVSAWDAAKNPVVVADSPTAGFTWSAASATVTLAGSATGSSAEFTGGTPNVTVEKAIKVTIGGKTCTAQVQVLSNAAPPVGTVNVLVTDELTGRPIPGASVLASNPTTGAAIGAAVPTLANGLVAVAGIPGATVTVTAFHASYNYLTIANYDLNGSRFLSFVLRRNQVDKYGGYKGTFKKVPTTSNLHVGLAGSSLAGSITDLSFSQLLGPSVPTAVKVSTIDRVLPLPAGVYFGFIEQVFKGPISAQGLAGVCLNSAGEPDEAAINAGTCGTRTAWGLAGDVPLTIVVELVAGGTEYIDFSKVLSRIVPVFKNFSSSIVRDVQFSLKPTSRNDAGEYVFSEADGGLPDFTPVDHNVFQVGVPSVTDVPLSFAVVTKVPDLPKFRNSYVDAITVLGGSIVPGRGVVPLGIGAAVNTDATGAKTDPQSDLVAGLVPLRMAPNHHGIEGSPYAVVALGLSLKSLTDASAGLATSAIFARVAGNALKFDPKGINAIDLGTSFPGFPESAKYNFSSTDAPGLPHRTFKFFPDPLNPNEHGYQGSSLTRVVFSDDAQHDWVVYLDPTQGTTTGFTLPTPPGTFADRTFTLGVNTGARSRFLVQQIRLSENPAVAASPALTFTRLVELNSTNADRLVDFTTGFSIVDYARPTVTWTTPAAGGTNVIKGSKVVVEVKAFKVGSTTKEDGFVRLSFAPANPTLCPDVDVKTDVSMGKGLIEFIVPSTCVLANATMTASLLTIAGAALDPPVSRSQTANIQ